MSHRYSIMIQWSEADQCYVVSLPEWGGYCHTHGETYEAALKNAQDVLELLTESTRNEGKPLPEPQLFDQSLQHI
ncbi:MAG TPA: type II toxin-antitoxin system HicB family antitoxin [Leptolyngbyaceae cyanobacterium M33_DOE_097]|uniref:Type II toxin-antitoxin system HicB family antitoxin n=1 Tax=Oscillatoriales cyanobacterium SpSt-418 TaxID=2282169 RepID=A0A7C3PGW0_9CYAN|nr:type II toxin-antitoxin system HicB family antitoxin [Leptolyngbyaceae cyanobacterium M33_DOE_097]